MNDDFGFYLFFFFFWALFAMVSATVAGGKGRNSTHWFIAGLFVSPVITLVVALLIDPKETPPSRLGPTENFVKPKDDAPQSAPGVGPSQNVPQARKIAQLLEERAQMWEALQKERAHTQELGARVEELEQACRDLAARLEAAGVTVEFVS